MTASRRYRNVLANPRVAPVKEIIRIHPRRVISWHLDPDNPDGASRRVGRARFPWSAGIR